MLSLLFVLILNLSEILAFTYYPGPLSYSDAKQFCRDVGSTLATITTVANRIEALAAIDGRAAPWIGLEHKFKSDGSCFFHYPEESNPQTICPLYPNYKCVAFWVNYTPLRVENDGHECVAYYPSEHHGDGAVNNDVPCDTRRPFICHESPQVCDTEDFECTSESLTWCAFGSGIDGLDCYCEFDADGISRCVSDFFCNTLPQCDMANGNDDCSDYPGTVCVTGGCCEETTCTPLCGEDLPIERRRTTRRRLQDRISCTNAYNNCES